MGVPEINFISDTNTNLEFYFAEDFSLNEMCEEINKFITDELFINKYDTIVVGDWTRVPIVKHKIKLIRAYDLWDK